MDRWMGMSTFVKVVDCGGFAAAARALDMSPAAVTTQVQSLEKGLEVRLLNRSTRRISLTEVGQAYYQRCAHILAEVEDADQIAHALQSTPSGTLRLNTDIPIPPLIAPVIAEYARLYPKVRVDMTMTDRMVDLVEEGFDLAVRNMPMTDSSLVVRRIAPFRFVICATPDYFSRYGIPQQPEDLTRHNCLIYSQSPWKDEWLLTGPNGEQRVRVSGTLRSNSSRGLSAAALCGQGLLHTSTFVVAEYLKSGQLVPVLGEFLQREYSIHAVYVHRQLLSTKVRVFLDLLAKHFQADPVRDEPDRAA